MCLNAGFLQEEGRMVGFLVPAGSFQWDTDSFVKTRGFPWWRTVTKWLKIHRERIWKWFTGEAARKPRQTNAKRTLVRCWGIHCQGIVNAQVPREREIREAQRAQRRLNCWVCAQRQLGEAQSYWNDEESKGKAQCMSLGSDCRVKKRLIEAQHSHQRLEGRARTRAKPQSESQSQSQELRARAIARAKS